MFDGLAQWLSSLPPWFAFMLALPFVVALVGLLRLAIEERRRE